jgi:hypothetical protein
MELLLVIGLTCLVTASELLARQGRVFKVRPIVLCLDNFLKRTTLLWCHPEYLAGTLYLSLLP